MASPHDDKRQAGILEGLSVLIHQDDIQTAQIRILNLKPFKKLLADKWDRVSGFVHKAAKHAIENELSPSDATFRYDELTYLVVFHDSSVEAAQSKCTGITSQVSGQLFGKDQERLAWRDMIQTIDVRDVVKAKAASPSVDAVSGPSEHRLQEADIAWQRSHSFTYRPVWDASRNVILHYLCQPQKNNVLMASQGQQARWDGHKASADFMVLRECVSRIENLHKDGLRVFIGAPIHFETIADPHQWPRFASLLRGTSKTVLQTLGFLVIGIDDGVPASRLLKELPKLSHKARSTYCVVQKDECAGLRFSGSGVHAIGLHMRAKVGTERHWIERARKLANQANAYKMESFILGATKPSFALNAIASGIRYVEGSAIGEATPDPRHAFAHAVEDLYLRRVSH